MYLHIGKNVMVNQNQIIGIFDLNTIAEKEQKFYSKLEGQKKIIDVSEGHPKTFILIKKENEILGFISNISSITLGKRTR